MFASENEGLNENNLPSIFILLSCGGLNTNYYYWQQLTSRNEFDIVPQNKSNNIFSSRCGGPSSQNILTFCFFLVLLAFCVRKNLSKNSEADVRQFLVNRITLAETISITIGDIKRRL